MKAVLATALLLYGTHGTREWDERLPGYADQVVAWLAERMGR